MKTQEKQKDVVARLKAWRTKNNLSQRQAVMVLQANGFKLSTGAIQKWEGGFLAPGRMATLALTYFLNEHPTITDPPKVRASKDHRGRPSGWNPALPESKVAEIRALRAQGLTLLSIAERLGVSESTVSRIAGKYPSRRRLK